MEEFRHIGKASQRKDGLGIVTGRTQFCDDLDVGEALYAKVKRSPHPHAEIISIDAARARELPGVHTVMTYKEAPEWMTGNPPHRKVLDKKVRFVGDAVALVAATSVEAAEKAIELIEVQYKVLPAVFDPEEALKPDAPVIYEQYPNNTFPPGSPFEHGGPPFYQIKMGDVEKAMKESAVVAEDTVAFDIITFPGAPEPPMVIARWDTENDLTIWGTTQHPHLMRINACFATNASAHAIVPNVGGSYGNKGSLGYSVLVAAALAQATGETVKYRLTKNEQMISYDQRLCNRFTGRVGMTEDGLVSAIDGMWIVDAGNSSDLVQGQMSEGLGELHLVMAKTKNWDIDSRCAITNHIQGGIVKGFGGQELKSCVMHLWARAMKKLGIDPYECLKRNFNEPGDEYYWRDGKIYKNKGVDYVKCFEEAAEKFDWKNKWKGWGVPTSVNGNKARGVGVGLHMSAEPGADDSFAYVRLDFDGTVTVHSCIPEHGAGQRLAGAKVAAETLNLPLEKVTVAPCDTLINPAEFGLAGSRGTRTIGTAIGRAASNARKELLEKGAKILGIDPEQADTRDGIVFNKAEPGKGIPWIAIIGPYESITGHGEFKEDFNAPNCFITFLEVEVDTDTGLVELVRVVGASDVGQIIDPVQLTLQFHGGLGAAGIDTGHLEEHMLDETIGRVMTHNMIDYKWRTFNQLPEYDAVILESKWDTHPYKAIGIAEVTGAGGPAAMLMAIENALGGVEINRYPASPDVVLRLLKKA